MHLNAKKENTSETKRIPKKGWVLIGIGVIVVIAAAVLGGIWFNANKDHNAARDDLETVIDKTGDVDRMLVPLDESINSPNTTDTVEVNQKLLTTIDPALDEVSSLKREVGEIRPKLRDSDKELAHVMEGALDGRKEMLDVSRDIISLDTSASAAMTLIDTTWNDLLDAHSKADAATKSANTETKPGREASLKMNTEVQTKLNEVGQNITKVKQMFPDADLSAFEHYLVGQRLANSFAITSDKALIAGDAVAANKAIDQLNKQNAILAKEIQGLKYTPESVIQKIYEARVTPLLETYSKVKEETAEKDQRIRELRDNTSQ